MRRNPPAWGGDPRRFADVVKCLRKSTRPFPGCIVAAIRATIPGLGEDDPQVLAWETDGRPDWEIWLKIWSIGEIYIYFDWPTARARELYEGTWPGAPATITASAVADHLEQYAGVVSP